MAKLKTGMGKPRGKIELRALGESGSRIRALGNGVPKDEVCISGRCGYSIKHNQVKGGHG